jgi:hypothetical protein
MVSGQGDDYVSAMENNVLRLNLCCPNCKQLGLATYDRNPSPELVAVYGRFHSESGRSPAPMIVCNECDMIQDDLAA